MAHDEPSLFDLPLAPPGDEPEDEPEDEPKRPARRPRPAAVGAPQAAGAPGETRDLRPAGAGELPLFPSGGDEDLGGRPFEDDADHGPASPAAPARPDREPAAAGPAGPADAPEAGAATGIAAAATPAGWTARVLASLADGAFLGTALVGVGLGATLLGVWPDAGALAPLALFALVFSFVYSVVPLAFWGRTPGMAAAGLVSRDADGGPLTFGQTGLRWLGGLLTLAAAGLPLLLALGPLGGRSLADRLSGSRTWAAARR